MFEDKIVLNPGLLTRVQRALGVTQQALGEELNASARTVMRWQQGRSGPRASGLLRLVPRLHGNDPKLAQEVVAECGATLDDVGELSPSSIAGREHLVDAVVCAAAEAMATAPQSVRPALHAALVRARALGLSMRDVIEGTAPRRA